MCLSSGAGEAVIRVGHFMNITHAQALIARGLSRAGKGWFESYLGPDVRIEWYSYNAGPSAMEAIFSKSLDLSYVGPNPAINAHLRSKGNEIRIVAGACSGGAALVVRRAGSIQSDSDFKGTTIATPQFGNTQDIAARAWLLARGYKVTMTGGDVLVVPTRNPDQLVLFQKGSLDGVWTIEPWVSRLVLEAKGKVYLDEASVWPETQSKYVTTHLVSGVGFIEHHPQLLSKWIEGHVALTEWIGQNPAEAKRVLNDEMKALTRQALAEPVLDRAWSHLELTHDPITASLKKSADDAFRLGFLRRQPDLTRIYDLRFLNRVLVQRHSPEITP